MSKAVPHFSAEWLEQYNRRLRAMSEAQAEDGKARQASHNPPPRTDGNQGGELTPYAAKAAAVPSRGWAGRQTKTEERYNRDVLRGLGRFEAVCLYLPGGGRYTPDFMTIDDGTVTFHEVKGSYRLGSQGRAHTAFQEAAAAFPMWRFVWAVERARKDGGGFDVRRFEPGFDADADAGK